LKSESLDRRAPGTMRNIMQEIPFMFLIMVGFIPFIALSAYIAWPEITSLLYLSNGSALLSGSLLLSAALDKATGYRRTGFSVTLILFVLISGTLLFPRFGWVSTLLILGVSTILCIVTGFMRRFADRS
jgi:hypothetical protein